MARVEVTISEAGTAPHDLEELVLDLAQELRDLPLDTVEKAPAATAPPPGTRADATMLSDVVLAVVGSTAVMTSVAQVLVAWLQRSAGRSVSLSDGRRTVTVNGATRGQTEEVLRHFLAAEAHGGDSDHHDPG